MSDQNDDTRVAIAETGMVPAVRFRDGSVWTELRPAKYAKEFHGQPTAKYRAVQIAEAVNAHAGLVRALRTLADLCEERGVYPLNVEDARAALKMAEGGDRP